MRTGCDRLYQFGLISTLALLGWISGESASAQIIPDETLGDERSVVRQGVQVRGGLGDRIEGGATRGANLFHSFQEFNVGEGQRVYFGNPDDITNIFSRVTGGNPSNILGVLGVDGTANLFFLNPNGILFGPNASLDVGGSFIATTANGIQFGEQGFFSATNPETPSQLLTIDPSAFFFNQVPQGNIISRSIRPDQQGDNFLGLRVPDGENLLLLGGNVSIDGSGGGGLYAFGGRIDIGAVRGIGSVELNADSSLNFPNGLNRANVSFTNQAQVYVLLDNGGNIAVTAGNIDVLAGSALYAGIFPGLGSVNSQAGNVKLDATGTIQIDQSSTVRNAVFAGSIGNAGNIEITAESLLILNGAQLQAIIWGQGDAGNILINASNRVTFRGSTPDGNFRSSILSLVDSQGNGTGGNVNISTPVLELFDGAQISASTFGQGDAGNVIISATDRVILRGSTITGQSTSSILSIVEPTGNGAGGNVEITTPILEVLDGAQLSTSTNGQGDAGNVIISATDRIALRGSNPDESIYSSAYSIVDSQGDGAGGNVEITTPILEVLDGAQLSAGTRGQGDAGNVIISATDRVILRGSTITGQSTSSILSGVEINGNGAGGNVEITTPILEVLDGAQLVASTSEQGDAGNVVISATDRITLRGKSTNASFNSAILSSVEPSGNGAGGNIEITTPILEVLDRAQLSAATFGQGNAGDVTIRGAETITLDRSSISTAVNRNAIGQGGDIDIRTGLLQLDNQSQISSSTLGRGNTGAIVVRATDGITLDDRSQITSSVERNAIGDSQSITLHTSDLSLNNRSQISAATAGRGNAGDILVQNAQQVDLDSGSSISTAVNENAVGQGGTIDIATEVLNLDDRSEISAQSQGRGVAGDIQITAREQVTTTNSDIITASSRSSGGDIRINSSDVRLWGDSDIRTNSGVDGGNITLSADTILAFEDSDILAFAERQGGDITFDTDAFFGENYFGSNDRSRQRLTQEELEELDQNGQVDINATGAVSSGTITTPDTSFIQNSLTDLPESAIDTDNLLANSCVVRSQEQGGTFIITGAEGLPQRPGDTAFPTYPTGAVRSIPDQTDSDNEPSWQMGDPIVEPEGVYQLPDGQLVLSRECD